MGTLKVSSKIEDDYIFKGEVNQYEFDFAPAAGRLGTSVSSADWSTDDTSIISLASESLTSSVAKVLITGSNLGCALLKCEAVLADGQKIIRYIRIKVREPSC